MTTQNYPAPAPARKRPRSHYLPTAYPKIRLSIRQTDTHRLACVAEATAQRRPVTLATLAWMAGPLPSDDVLVARLRIREGIAELVVGIAAASGGAS
jgi:hypothetical protein